MQEERNYDAIVVGSGVTGGWAAKELCEQGLKTLVLERGRPLEHITGYETANMAPWEFENRGTPSRKDKEIHPVQSRIYAYNEGTKHMWINDPENPYTTAEGKEFRWIRGDHVGGKSLMWHRHVPRWSNMDFEANLKDGHGVDWPLRYPDIAPWYDYVERFIGVSGSEEGLDQLPNGQFLPPFEMTCIEKHIKEKIEGVWKDRVSGVRVIDAENGNVMEFKAKVVFLCAGTLATTHILLNSSNSRFPDGLANSSGELGKNLMDHHGNVGAFGIFEGFEESYHSSGGPHLAYIPRFRNIQESHPDFIRGYHFTGAGRRINWKMNAKNRGIGTQLKESLKLPAFPGQTSIIIFRIPRYCLQSSSTSMTTFQENSEKSCRKSSGCSFRTSTKFSIPLKQGSSSIGSFLSTEAISASAKFTIPATVPRPISSSRHSETTTS